MNNLRLILTSAAALVTGAFGAFAETEEWIPLFNGKDLSGWHVEGGSAEFAVENGEIVGTVVTNTPGNTFLCTDETFDDFVLEVDWKLEKQPTNSGIQFRSETRPDKTTKHGTCVFGYQAEISLPKDRCGRIYDEGRRGFMNGLVWLDAFTPKARLDASAATIDHAKWNTTRIECRGYRIQTWVNGKPVVNILDDATMKGFVGLQVHAGNCPGGVRFRNIRLCKLARLREGER